MMNTQTVILDVDKRYDPSQVVTIGQGDKSGTTIVAEVYDKGVSVSLSGYTAEFEMRLPDGRNYVRDDDCTVSGNTITYVVDEEHCGAAAGHTNECYFNIKYGSSVIYSTSRFRMDVLRAAHDGAVPSESWDSAIEEAIENANEAAEEAREAAGGTVPLMSATQRGGAKLGDGLALTGEALGVDPLTTTEIDTVASDGSLTSSKALTGTMLTYLWSKIKAKFASLVNGAVAISQGGTGATTAALARTNLDAAQSNGASGTLKAAEDGIDDLEASLAYVESTTATANHAVGDYFMLVDVLMKATAAIAAGETITASNATPATVQGQIDTLRDSVGFLGTNTANVRFAYWNDEGSAIRINGTNGKFYYLTLTSGGVALMTPDGVNHSVAKWSSTSIAPNIVYQSGYSQRGAYFYERDGIVYFNLGINHSNALSAAMNYHVATIPEGYRPIVSAAFYDMNSANNGMAQIIFETDGRINVSCGLARGASGWFWARGSYLIA